MLIPIYTKGERTDTANFHPINITSMTFRMLKRVIRDEITSHLKLQQLTDEAQHEFLSGRSYLANLPSAVTMINRAEDEGSDVDFCFLDFSKIFDVVNNRIIWAKLLALRVSSCLVTLTPVLSGGVHHD